MSDSSGKRAFRPLAKRLTPRRVRVGRYVLAALIGALVACASASASGIPGGGGLAGFGGSAGARAALTVGTPALRPAESYTFPITFSSSTGGKTLIETKSGKKITCTEQTGTGSFTSAKEGVTTMTWTGCESAGIKCGKAGEVQSKELKTLLAYTYPAKSSFEGRQTGLVLSAASGGVVAEFSCSTKKIVLTGSFLGVITPLNAPLTHFTWTIEQSGGAQEPSEYETESGGVATANMACSENEHAGESCGIEENYSPAIVTDVEATVEAEGEAARPLFMARSGYNYGPVPFTTSGEKMTLETTSGKTIKCKSEAATGDFDSRKEATLTIKWNGCESAGVKCGTAGEVESKSLKGLLAYTYPVKEGPGGRETGLVLSPASGEVVAEMTCSAKHYTLKGSVIALISPHNVKSKVFTLSISRSGASQVPSEYETEAGGVVAAGLACTENSKAAEACGEEATARELALTLSTEEATVEV
jgi:hypothetical protein